MVSGIVTKRDIWAAARVAVEGGASYPEVSVKFGINVNTLRTRSFREKWDSPQRRFNNLGKPTGDAREPDFLAKGDSVSGNSEKTELSTPLPDILAAVKEGPEAYRAAMKQYGQIATAAALREIPLPRTLAEVKTWQDIIAQQEKKDPAGVGDVIRPATVLARAPIEVEEVAKVDGFAI